MKIKDGFVLRPLGEEYIIIGEDIARVDFNKIISLNATAAYLWENLEGKEFSIEDMVDLLIAKYDVDRETALNDSVKLAEKFVSAEILE